MTRLVQVIAGGKHGGAEAFFVRLAKALARAGVDQHLVIRSHPERAAELRAAGIGVDELAFGGWLDWRSGPALRRILHRHAPSIVLSWMNRATAAVPPGPWVHAARLGGYYNLKYYRRAQHLIGNTPDIVGWLRQQGRQPERTLYLPNFVDSVPSAPVPRASLTTPDDAPLLLAMGRLHKVKGFDLLLTALAQVPSAYLWVAGEGGERASLEALAGSLGVAGRVRFLGWRSDTAALLAAADVLVCPSRVEPLGNVVIEAWAHRVAVLATRAAGPSGLIRSGESGILVPVEDAPALAHAISLLIERPEMRRRLAEAGYADYLAHFTEASVVAAYCDFFDRIAPACAA